MDKCEGCLKQKKCETVFLTNHDTWEKVKGRYCKGCLTYLIGYQEVMSDDHKEMYRAIAKLS